MWTVSPAPSTSPDHRECDAQVDTGVVATMVSVATSMAETLNATGNKLEAAPDDEDFDNPLHVPTTSFV